MKKLLVYILLLSSLVSVAQTSSYTITKENTDIKCIYGKISLLEALISTSRMSLSTGLGTRMYFNGIYVSTNYDFHYADNLAEASSSENIRGNSVYARQKSRNADIMAGYFFQKDTEGKVRINLHSGSKTTYYTMVDAHYNKIFGAQIGFKNGFSYMTIPQGVTVSNYYNESAGTFAADAGMTTIMKYSWLTIGGTFGKTVDVDANFTQYGSKGAHYMKRFYANAIIAVKSQLEDVYFTENYGSSNELVKRYVLNGNVDMSRFGFCIGAETFSLKKFGMITSLEAGMMPGVKTKITNNIFIGFKVGLVIGSTL
ncbi:MAG: hypothetical protein HY062_00830 [Bacteroidetes bacterium]|nr:hypothetical protein [Bacteroidota bacterium]